jgi:hypothetical protein
VGDKALARYLVDEIQEVYKLQGVKINDKHIEVIVRQMLKRVRVKEVGDTHFLVDDQVEKYVFEEENEKVLREGGKPAVGEPLFLGITKASLITDSFISAASFQETTKVLTQAAVAGKVDNLKGLRTLLEALSRDVYAQIDKVRVVKKRVGETYRLVPQGFLGVFRGRNGMTDCSFDMDKGTPLQEVCTRIPSTTSSTRVKSLRGTWDFS